MPCFYASPVRISKLHALHLIPHNVFTALKQICPKLWAKPAQKIGKVTGSPPYISIDRCITRHPKRSNQAVPLATPDSSRVVLIFDTSLST